MSKFKSVVTALGQARIASAIESGKDVNITQLAVGDGNGSATTPSASQTALVHETYRLPLNSIKTDNKNANWIIAEAIIPASVGGFWMREMGLFSSEGELIAVSNMADSYKPTLEEGSGRTQTLRMVITVTDTDAVTLTIDDTLVIATEEYVNNLLAEHEASRRHPDGTLTDKGFVQLSSAIDSASEVLAATPKAVKTVNDNANGRLPSGGTAVAATKLATARKIAGVPFDGTADISIPPANVGALPSGGTAVAATKLVTARKIAGVAFDGTADISLNAGNVGAYPQSGGNVGGYVNATYLSATQPAVIREVQGTFIGWNETNGQGESHFINNKGGGVGGFVFRTVNSGNTVQTGYVRFSGTGDVSSQGNLSTDAGGIYEMGQRVYSPNNPQNLSAYAPVSWVNQFFLSSMRHASATWSGAVGGGLQVPAGCVVIGARNNGSSDVAKMGLLYAAEQIFVNGNWVTIGLA